MPVRALFARSCALSSEAFLPASSDGNFDGMTAERVIIVLRSFGSMARTLSPYLRTSSILFKFCDATIALAYANAFSRLSAPGLLAARSAASMTFARSEERRVGKESGWLWLQEGSIES